FFFVSFQVTMKCLGYVSVSFSKLIRTNKLTNAGGYWGTYPSLTTPQSLTAGHFTLNLTLTNLRYTADLGVPGTQKFKSTQSIMKYYWLRWYSSIGPIYTGCKVMAFRSVRKSDDTGVDTLCSYKNNPSVAKFNRVQIYQELRIKTKGVTKLGIYALEKNSLYVDGLYYNPIMVIKHPSCSPNSPVLMLPCSVLIPSMISCLNFSLIHAFSEKTQGLPKSSHYLFSLINTPWV
uniref:SEA domain-containing protein n=1 Tax=Crocodylus porosus TaxID=8502 RepID=A0A7M4ESR6_CROPO